MRKSLVVVLFMLGVIFAYAPLDLDASNRPLFHQGMVKVRLTENAKISKSLQIKERGKNYLVTGISSIDDISKKVSARDVRISHIEAKNKNLATKLGLDRWLTLNIPEDADVMAVVELYKSDPNIDLAQPEYANYLMATPNDQYFANSWGHNNTVQLHGGPDHTWPVTVGTAGFDANTMLGWDGTQGYGDPNVVIAVMDTGIDYDHPDLINNYIGGWDAAMNDTNPDDNEGIAGKSGHGTSCAGIIAGEINNTIGVAGVAGNCSIMAIKILNSSGSLVNTGNGAIYAADNGADILSMSFGGNYQYGADPSTDAAYSYAYTSGVTLLASTGNDNLAVIGYPANHPDVIAIGAAAPDDGRKDPTSADGETWWGSNYGVVAQDDRAAVDLLAPTILPTTDIVGSGGLDPGDYKMFFNGTSCACPYAAGFAGLIKSRHPSYTPDQIRQVMVFTARDVVNTESSTGWDRFSGYGIIDIGKALGFAPTAPPSIPVLTTPVNGSTLFTGIPTFDWQDTAEAASYTILVDNDPNFGSPEINEFTILSDYTPESNLAQTTYYWKVLATNELGSTSSTAWNTTISFPDINLSKTQLSTTTAPGLSVVENFDIGNTGTGALNYSTSISYTGGKVIKGSGGPDTYGYEWVDSDEDGLTYNWNDISGTGTEATTWTPTGGGSAKDEGYSGPYNLGFDFSFYGVTYTQAYIGSNGWLMFTTPQSDTYTNVTIPTPGHPDGYLAAFWDDLNGSSQGTVHYKQIGNSFVVQYTNWPDYNSTNGNTFQIVLGSTGSILYQYNDMNGDIANCTVGIESPTGTDGSLTAFNTTYLKNNFAIRYSEKRDWLSIDPSSGSVGDSGTDVIAATCDATGLSLGVYTADITISSNDPDEPTKILPVTFTVEFAVPVFGPPKNVQIINDGSTISLGWDIVTGADQYYIYGKSTPGSTSVFLDSTANTLWTTPNVYDKYFFEITAKDSTQPPPPAGMVFVQGGTFQMGDHFNEGESNELPLHSVTISGFYMGVCEVTQSEWATYMPSENWSSYGTGDNYPAYFTNWYKIMVYCNKRSIAEGITPCYTISSSTNPDDWGTIPTSSNSTWDVAICNWSANGYRLPSEAEWEYASRGGIHNADNYRYSGSNTIGDVAWYSPNSGTTSHLVGAKAPNQLGIYDMSGNLWEWCWDWHGSYTSDAQSDPIGPASGSNRTLRGASWANLVDRCRIAYRGNIVPYGNNYQNIGFRISRTP